MAWELTVVENAGEIPAEKVTDTVAVPTEPLLIDIKAQLLMHKPKTLAYTVGWRALVWQNKETGQFKDISEAEYEEYIRTGTINPTPSTGKDAGQVEPTSGDEVSDDGGTTSSS
jgi:hypothetical protein